MFDTKIIPLRRAQIEQSGMEEEVLDERIERALACLPMIQQYVLTERYSLDSLAEESLHSSGGRSFEEIAGSLHTTPEVVDQMESAALRMLRHPSPRGSR